MLTINGIQNAGGAFLSSGAIMRYAFAMLVRFETLGPAPEPSEERGIAIRKVQQHILKTSRTHATVSQTMTCRVVVES